MAFNLKRSFVPFEKPRVREGFSEKELQLSETGRRPVSSAIPGKSEANEDKGFSQGVLSLALSLHEQRKYEKFLNKKLENSLLTMN